jgi:hypothetical protein
LAGPQDRDDPVRALEQMLAESEAETVRVEPPSAPVLIESVADPLLLALVTGRARPDIVREHTPHTYAREPRTHLDPADWRAGFLEVHEGGPPPDVREALAENTPQAHLRDLFRPVFNEAPVPLDLNPLPLDPGGRQAYAEVRAALVREPMPRVARSLELLAETRAEWRAFVDTPWQPFLRDEEPRRDVQVAIEPSLSS